MMIDDHTLVRAGLKALIARQPDMEVIAEAASADDAVDALQRHTPDVCTVDLSLPDISGTALIKQIHARQPECRVLVVSMHDEATHGTRAFRAQVIEAIRKVAAGEVYMTPQMQKLSLNALMSGQSSDSGENEVGVLTDREHEILRLIGMGLSGAEIAARLHRSVKTIDVHRQNLKQKLRLNSTANLTIFAARWLQQEQEETVPGRLAV
jgi:DNA-binding NarL/FixJ family response regulator